jgi:hypothetical protein
VCHFDRHNLSLQRTEFSMKTNLTLAALAAKIQYDEGRKADYLVPAASDLKMTPEATIAFKGSMGAAIELPANDTAHGQLAGLLNVPKPYYDRMRNEAPALLASNVNTWLERSPAGKRQMLRTYPEHVRAILSDSYRRIDHSEVAEVALTILGERPNLQVVSCDVTESRLYIKAIDTSVVLPVQGSKRVGDLVEAGVCVSNSESGQGSLSIKPFHRYLACLNGMVLDKGGMRAAHIGRKADVELQGLLSEGTRRLEDELVLRKLRDVVRACFDMDKFRAFMDQVSATTQQQITGDVNAAIEVLGNSTGLGLNGGERSSVLAHLVRGGDLSRFGLMNAVTRTAEDVSSYDRATELEAAGFRLIDMPAREWQSIAAAKPLATV